MNYIGLQFQDWGTLDNLVSSPEYEFSIFFHIEELILGGGVNIDAATFFVASHRKSEIDLI